MTTNRIDIDVSERAAARVAAVADAMHAEMPRLGDALLEELAGAIPELRGDKVILDLLKASTVGNVESFLHVAGLKIPIEEVRPPSAAVEYGRRLAQRGISANAMLRAYRLGQARVLDYATDEIAREEPDLAVAYAAAQTLTSLSFAYVDRVAELVVAEYEAERERWVANRNTVRAARLASVLAGHDDDLATSESALGYRLRQQHLAIVVWDDDTQAMPSQLRQLEALAAAVGDAVGAVGQPLFLPQDGALAWVWLPLGRASDAATVVDISAIAELVTRAGPTARLALGMPGASSTGFRSSHQQALQAHAVASAAGAAALPVTSFADPGVQVAAILAHDLTATRALVRSALGGLGGRDDNSARLRETLHAFLGAKSSYLATAEVVHLHKNTVKYRIDKAIEARGRPIDDDRLNLELALTASRWLGPAVLDEPGQARA